MNAGESFRKGPQSYTDQYEPFARDYTRTVCLTRSLTRKQSSSAFVQAFLAKFSSAELAGTCFLGFGCQADKRTRRGDPQLSGPINL